MNNTSWQPLVIGIAAGLLAGVGTVTNLSFLISGITDNAIGFFVTLFLLAAVLGGPLAGAIAPALWVTISTFFGLQDMQAVIIPPDTFWSNLIALGVFTALVGFAYRLIFERLKMPVRLSPWAGIVVAYYFVTLPASITPQYLLSGDPTSEILPAVLSAYTDYIPQAIFDIFFTCLVFIALPAPYSRPIWYEPKQTPELPSEIQDA